MKRNILTRSTLSPLALILLLYSLVNGTPVIAQHVLYARGAGETISNFNVDHILTLENGKLYPVVGMRDKTLTINTPAGLYPYNGNNFVVSDGGQYSSLKISATHEGSKLSGAYVSYSSQLHTPQSIGQVYCVVQWTDATDGRVFQTSCQRIGTLNSDSATERERWANDVHLYGTLPTPITADDVKFSFYVWSGSVEVAVESVSPDEEEARHKLERKMLRDGNGQ